MERCQIAERNAAGLRLIFLHYLVQHFEIGHFGHVDGFIIGVSRGSRRDERFPARQPAGCVAVSCMSASPGCGVEIARPLRKLRCGCCATMLRDVSPFSARPLRFPKQVVLRVVLTDVQQHCCCHCPAIAGTLRGHDARNFAGFLAGCFAPIARPSRGTPRNHRRDFGEP